MPHLDHRQLGAKIATCPECGRSVWSRQPSMIVTARPLVIRHVRCPPNTSCVVP